MCHYATAQVCLGGHAITGNISLNHAMLSPSCPYCGEKTITHCPSCNAQIRGDYIAPDVYNLLDYHPPAYCWNCGEPFPWTKAKLDAAEALAKETNVLSDDEIKRLHESLPNVIVDKPNTILSARRISAILKKLPKVAAFDIHDVIVEIAAETAKRVLWPGG